MMILMIAFIIYWLISTYEAIITNYNPSSYNFYVVIGEIIDYFID